MEDKLLQYSFYFLMVILLPVLCLYHGTPYFVVFCLFLFSIGFSAKVPNSSKKRRVESQIWKVNYWISSR